MHPFVGQERENIRWSKSNFQLHFLQISSWQGADLTTKNFQLTCSFFLWYIIYDRDLYFCILIFFIKYLFDVFLFCIWSTANLNPANFYRVQSFAPTVKNFVFEFVFWYFKHPLIIFCICISVFQNYSFSQKSFAFEARPIWIRPIFPVSSRLRQQ